MATLNYYFLNLPWLVKDPGVNLTAEGIRRLWDDDTGYKTVRRYLRRGGRRHAGRLLRPLH